MKLRLPRSRSRRVALVVALVLPVLLTAGCVLVPRIASHVMVHPFRRENRVLPTDRGMDYETVAVRAADDVELAGWWVPPAGEPKGAVIYFHGINDRRYKGLRYAVALRERGIATLMLDLRAHGESGGDVCTFGWRERHDVVAAVDWVNLRLPGKPVGLIGESLGGAVAIQGAALLGERLDALVSVSTFADLPSTVANYAHRILGPFATDDMIAQTQERAGEIADFPPEQVRPVDAIATVTAPTLIVHGTADGWIPIANAEALIAASGAEHKRLVPIEGAGHGDIHRHSGDVWRVEVIDWLDEHLVAETAVAPVAAPAAPQ